MILYQCWFTTALFSQWLYTTSGVIVIWWFIVCWGWAVWLTVTTCANFRICQFCSSQFCSFTRVDHQRSDIRRILTSKKQQQQKQRLYRSSRKWLITLPDPGGWPQQACCQLKTHRIIFTVTPHCLIRKWPICCPCTGQSNYGLVLKAIVKSNNDWTCSTWLMPTSPVIQQWNNVKRTIEATEND